MYGKAHGAGQRHAGTGVLRESELPSQRCEDHCAPALLLDQSAQLQSWVQCQAESQGFFRLVSADPSCFNDLIVPALQAGLRASGWLF